MRLIDADVLKEDLTRFYDGEVTARQLIDAQPSVQPEPCKDDPRADIYYLAEKIGIHQLYALVVKLRGEPEPCEDAISRQETIHAISDWIYDTTDERLPETVIRSLSAVQPEQRWIPCSESLPEDEQPILFSTTTGRVHQGRFHRDNSVNRWYSSLDKMRAYNNVVNAWMPLPEPYREE